MFQVLKFSLVSLMFGTKWEVIAEGLLSEKNSLQNFRAYLEFQKRSWSEVCFSMDWDIFVWHTSNIIESRFLGSVAEIFWTGGDSQVSYVPWSFPSRVQRAISVLWIVMSWLCWHPVCRYLLRFYASHVYIHGTLALFFAVRLQKIRPMYTSWHSMKSS